MEKGVFSALESRYLKSLTFAVFCKHPETGKEMLLETYQFHVEYPKTDDGKGSILLNGAPLTKDTLKKQAVTFIRALVEFSATLDALPEDRWLTLKLTVRVAGPLTVSGGNRSCSSTMTILLQRSMNQSSLWLPRRKIQISFLLVNHCV